MNRKNMMISAAVIVLSAFVPVLIHRSLVLQYLINMMIFAYLALAWNIIGGYAGQLALGNGVYLGIGAYVAAVLYTYEGISPWLGMLVAGLIAAILALLVGGITFRLEGSYFALATVAMLHIIRITFMSNEYILGYRTKGALSFNIKWNGGLMNMQFEERSGYYWLFLGLLVVGLLISAGIKNSKMGYYLQAICTNPDASGSLGVNVMGMKLIANCISAFMVAVGGSMYAFYLSVVDPSSVLGYDMSIKILLFAIIGGRETLLGPVFAAFILAPLGNILRGIVGASVAGLAEVIYGLVLMAAIYFMPKGVWPSVAGFFRKDARRQ
ncbi:MAG: branched-chain amino acid ABC transporter permease [Lachnospiraceae bacterium]|nr:branched-chain amino acid ABC transporter permease [Lachnospiraceae bacterium]